MGKAHQNIQTFSLAEVIYNMMAFVTSINETYHENRSLKLPQEIKFVCVVMGIRVITVIIFSAYKYQVTTFTSETNMVC